MDKNMVIFYENVTTGVYVYGFNGDVKLNEKDFLKKWDEGKDKENKDVMRYIFKKLLNLKNKKQNVLKGSISLNLDEVISHMKYDRRRTKDVLLFDEFDERYNDEEGDYRDYDLIRIDWEDIKETIVNGIEKMMKQKNKTFLYLSQDTGTWRGNRKGGKILHRFNNNFKEEIMRMGDSIEYVVVKVDSEGCLRYEMIHHDGTNVRYFHLLKDKYDKSCENSESKYYYQNLNDMYSDELEDMIGSTCLLKQIKWDDIIKYNDLY